MDPYQKVTASAFKELFNHAVQDTAILMFHQLAAKAYSEGKTESDESCYSPEEEVEMRNRLRDIVMKYHILHENGFGAKLTPLINNLINPQDLQQITDPELLKIVQNSNNFDNVNFANVLEEITKCPDIDESVIYSSYSDGRDDIEVAVFEDDTVQCACNFCEEFFQVVEMETPPMESLNPIQQLLAQNYSLV